MSETYWHAFNTKLSLSVHAIKLLGEGRGRGWVGAREGGPMRGLGLIRANERLKKLHPMAHTDKQTDMATL